MTRSTLARRDALKLLGAISATGALAACGSKSDTDTAAISKANADKNLAFYEKGKFLRPTEMALLAAISDTIIPTTDTGGAVAAGVPDTLQALVSEWGDNDMRASWRQEFARLKIALDIQTGKGEFRLLDQAGREAVLGPLDSGIFNGSITQHPHYRDMKSLIVTAYYMSEIGASEELAYEPVPGDFKGCVPIADYPKTWAT